MSEFRKFLVDVLDKVGPFGKSINHLHIKRTKTGDIVAAGPSTDRSVEIRATAKQDIPELEGVACMGSLLYLKQILGSSFLKSNDADSQIKLAFTEASDRKTTALKSIRIETGKLEVFYQATDPFYGNVVLPARQKPLDWPLAFSVDPATVKDFKELRAIQAAAPSTQTEDVFALGHNNGQILAMFGSGNQQSTLMISDTVEVEGKAPAGEICFLTEHFLRALDLCGKHNVVLYLCDKAVKMEFETPLALYEIILTAKIVIKR